MTFDEYQEKAKTTAIYPNQGNNVIYPTLGIAGEAGEISEKVKKIIRDKGGLLSDWDRIEIAKECGDLIWYLAALAREIDIDLNLMASMNLEKLQSRKDRGTLQGNGDNR